MLCLLWLWAVDKQAGCCTNAPEYFRSRAAPPASETGAVLLADCVSQHGMRVDEIDALSRGEQPKRSKKQASRATPREAFDRSAAVAAPILSGLRFDTTALRALEGVGGFHTRLTRA